MPPNGATAPAPTLDRWFVDSKETLAFARLTDGSMYPAQSAWQGFALAFGGLDPAKAARAAAHLARPELTTPWGARLFATDSPNYDPLSYNDGSVWPFVTGFAILGEYRNHQAAAALQLLHGIAAMNGLSAAGFIPEYLSGERAQALPHAVPHQLFSSSAVINPLVSGMLGLDGDAAAHTLLVAPQIPQGWSVRFENYRVGGSTVSGSIVHTRGEARLSLKIAGEPLAVTFVHLHKVVHLAPAPVVDARIAAEEPAEPAPVFVNPEPGARAPASSATGAHARSRHRKWRWRSPRPW